MDGRPLAAAAALLAAALAAQQALAGCCTAEPSALDLDPTAAPLLVAHDRPAAELVLSWESSRHDSVAWQGDLDRLWAESLLNDEPAGDTPGAELRLPLPAENTYFLVTASCNGLACPRGRDSGGAERQAPGCEILVRGDIDYSAASCLGVDQGVIRDALEYDAFAACFTPGWEPPPPGAGEALVWKTDYANAACGTCLEFTCAERAGDELILRPLGLPWGDCDAIHHGGAWALVPDAPSILFLEQMPPAPDYSPCN